MIECSSRTALNFGSTWLFWPCALCAVAQLTYLVAKHLRKPTTQTVDPKVPFSPLTAEGTDVQVFLSQAIAFAFCWTGFSLASWSLTGPPNSQKDSDPLGYVASSIAFTPFLLLFVRFSSWGCLCHAKLFFRTAYPGSDHKPIAFVLLLEILTLLLSAVMYQNFEGDGGYTGCEEERKACASRLIWCSLYILCVLLLTTHAPGLANASSFQRIVANTNVERPQLLAIVHLATPLWIILSIVLAEVSLLDTYDADISDASTAIIAGLVLLQLVFLVPQRVDIQKAFRKTFLGLQSYSGDALHAVAPLCVMISLGFFICGIAYWSALSLLLLIGLARSLAIQFAVSDSSKGNVRATFTFSVPALDSKEARLLEDGAAEPVTGGDSLFSKVKAYGTSWKGQQTISLVNCSQTLLFAIIGTASGAFTSTTLGKACAWITIGGSFAGVLSGCFTVLSRRYPALKVLPTGAAAAVGRIDGFLQTTR